MTPIMQEEGFDFERAKTEYLADQPMCVDPLFTLPRDED